MKTSFCLLVLGLSVITSVARADEAVSRPWTATVGGGALVGNGASGVGPFVRLEGNIVDGFHAGLEVGYLTVILGKSVPILATAMYRFNEQGSVRPYVGLVVGSISSRYFKFFSDQKDRWTDFAAFARVGLDIAITKRFSLTFEPRVGMVGEYVTAYPQIGASFHF